LKVRVQANPPGVRVTPETLNRPGQSFTGTVTEKRIQGVFEIEYKTPRAQRINNFTTRNEWFTIMTERDGLKE